MCMWFPVLWFVLLPALYLSVCMLFVSCAIESISRLSHTYYSIYNIYCCYSYCELLFQLLTQTYQILCVSVLVNVVVMHVSACA